MEKTENDLIFIEHDDALPRAEIEQCLRILEKACETGEDETVRAALHRVVPSYRAPEEVNTSRNIPNRD